MALYVIPVGIYRGSFFSVGVAITWFGRICNPR